VINSNDITSLVSVSKDLINDQTFKDLTKKFNTSGVSFDAVEGLGDATSTSSLVLINSGGFSDQRITAVLNFPSPTSAGSEDIGVMVRVLSVDSPDANYYFAHVDAGVAKITRVADGTFTTLSSLSFSLAQGTNVTITFSAVGDLLKATFDAGGSPATINLSATDSQIPARGCMGFRSLTSAVWCRSLTWEQL